MVLAVSLGPMLRRCHVVDGWRWCWPIPLQAQVKVLLREQRLDQSQVKAADILAIQH